MVVLTTFRLLDWERVWPTDLLKGVHVKLSFFTLEKWFFVLWPESSLFDGRMQQIVALFQVISHRLQELSLLLYKLFHKLMFSRVILRPLFAKLQPPLVKSNRVHSPALPNVIHKHKFENFLWHLFDLLERVMHILIFHLHPFEENVLPIALEHIGLSLDCRQAVNHPFLDEMHQFRKSSHF